MIEVTRSRENLCVCLCDELFKTELRFLKSNILFLFLPENTTRKKKCKNERSKIEQEKK